MTEKRIFAGGSGSEEDGQPPEKRIRTGPSFASLIREVVTGNALQHFSSAMEPLLRRVVQEEVDLSLRRRFRSLSRSSSLRIRAPPENSTARLIFSKNPQKPIFTGSKISDTDNNPLQVLLVDSNGDQMTLPHPIKLDIVALDGDFPFSESWTSEDFESNIVRERSGKRPLLAGDVSVTMRNGAAMIGEIEFTDNSSWIRSRKFRIGAKIARTRSSEEYCVREGITEAFTVRDHRGELYKKHHPPMLRDEVWRLEKIGKDGAFHKKLSSEGIDTVQDFLKLSVVDQSRLRRILGQGMSDKMWEVTLKHAKECVMGNKFYAYRGPTFIIILNPICQLVKALIDGRVFPSKDMTGMERAYIEGLIRQAYRNWTTLQEIEGAANDLALLTQSDEIVDQQYVNVYDHPLHHHHHGHHQNMIVRSFQDHNVCSAERSPHVEMNHMTQVNTGSDQDGTLEVTSGFFTGPVELGFCVSFSGL